MAVVEAVLVYRTDVSGEESVPVARTADPEVIRLLRDRLLRQAADEAAMWAGYDPALGAMKAADARRLASVLALLIPDEDLRPDLRVVPGGAQRPGADPR